MQINNITKIVGKSIENGDGILLTVKLTYSLKRTNQSPSSYPRNYTNSVSVNGFSDPSFSGNSNSKTASASFVAYAKIVGDFNGDFKVDLADLKILISTYGKTRGQVGFNPNVDLNDDGIINIIDAAIFALNYETG